MKLSFERLTAALRPLEQAGGVPRNGDELAAGREAAWRHAAVLVPLEQHAGVWRVLLSVRTAHMTLHAGQVSFPGGGWEAEDENLVATALRETTEETAIDREYVQVAGLLDDCRTITGYHITPVVGLLRRGYRLAPEPGEVSELFWMPLSRALNRERYRRAAVKFKDKQRYFYTQTYSGHEVWGATAAMLLNLGERLGYV